MDPGRWLRDIGTNVIAGLVVALIFAVAGAVALIVSWLSRNVFPLPVLASLGALVFVAVAALVGLLAIPRSRRASAKTAPLSPIPTTDSPGVARLREELAAQLDLVRDFRKEYEKIMGPAPSRAAATDPETSLRRSFKSGIDAYADIRIIARDEFAAVALTRNDLEAVTTLLDVFRREPWRKDPNLSVWLATRRTNVYPDDPTREEHYWEMLLGDGNHISSDGRQVTLERMRTQLLEDLIPRMRHWKEWHDEWVNRWP